MKRLYLAVFITCSVIAAGIGQACASATEPRVALVVGNAAYRNVAPLKNPVNDARDVAKALQELGFDVIRVEDANKQQLERAIGEFSSRLSEASVGLFYYSGHGIQESGHNYLIPVDANLPTEAAVMLEATDLDLVLMNMAKPRVNLVILDACRNNPFEHRFRAVGRGLAPVEQTPGGTLAAYSAAVGKIAPDGAGANSRHLRALGRGLAPAETARGTLVAYSTAPGTIAADGDGANGLYTSELLKAMAVPGLKVEDVFKAVRVAVSAASRDQQIPWESSSLTGDFFFTQAAPTPAAPPAVSPDTADVAFWNSVKADTSLAVFEEYLREFPNGRFASLAKLKIAELSVPTPRQANQATSVPQTALLTLARPPLGGSDDAAFHCPKPGTLIEYDDGTSMVFVGANAFSCTYRTKNKHEAEKFGALADDARFVDGLGKLWPLKVGGEQSFNVGAAVERFTVLRRETLTVDAGAFDTFVIEQEEAAWGQSAKRTFWYAPEIGLVVQSKYAMLTQHMGIPALPDSATIMPGDYEAVRIASAATRSDGSNAAFHCPQPGTLIEYDNGSSMHFLGVKQFSCTYKTKNRVAEKFGAFADDARFADGLGKLWPLKVGGEQSFNVGAAMERFTVLRRESVVIEAGTFDTFVIEQDESVLGPNGKRTFWYAPDLGLVVKSKFTSLPTRNYTQAGNGFMISPGDYEAVRIANAAQQP